MTHYTVQFNSAIPKLSTVSSLVQERSRDARRLAWNASTWVLLVAGSMLGGGAATENALSPNFRRVPTLLMYLFLLTGRCALHAWDLNRNSRNWNCGKSPWLLIKAAVGIFLCSGDNDFEQNPTAPPGSAAYLLMICSSQTQRRCIGVYVIF